MGQVTVLVDRKQRHVGVTTRSVDDGQPFLVIGNGDVCRGAWQRNRLVEQATSPIAKEDRDGLSRRITRAPRVSRALGNPARGIHGKWWGGSSDGMKISVFVEECKAIGTVRRGESKIILPKCCAKWNHVCIVGERNSLDCSAQIATAAQRQLKNGSGAQRHRCPGLADCDLRGRRIGESHNWPFVMR